MADVMVALDRADLPPEALDAAVRTLAEEGVDVLDVTCGELPTGLPVVGLIGIFPAGAHYAVFFGAIVAAGVTLLTVKVTPGMASAKVLVLLLTV